jgi:hypothetical protein
MPLRHELGPHENECGSVILNGELISGPDFEAK